MSRPDETTAAGLEAARSVYATREAEMQAARAEYDTQLRTAADALVAAIRAGATDGAETISHLLATAAANLGGLHALTAGRPGSWEADYVDQFLASTVGCDGEYLLQYRTAPIEIVECVESLLSELGISWLYDDSFEVIDRAEGEACSSDDQAVSDAACERYTRAEELIEQLRERDYTAYKEAFEARVRDAAEQLRSTRYLPESVPVRVRWVEWDDRAQAISGIDGRAMELWGTVEFELWETARLRTPPPGFAEPLADIAGPGDPGEVLRQAGRMPHQRIPELAHYAGDSTDTKPAEPAEASEPPATATGEPGTGGAR